MVAGYRELLEMKIRLIGEARFELTTSSSSTAPLLTKQALSSIVTIRLGGNRVALRRQIKLTRRPLSSFRAHSVLVKAVGILVPVGTCETSSEMLQTIEIADLLLQRGTSLRNGVPVGRTATSQPIENSKPW